ncbi:MAG: PGF-pre-PGF domain-containing protein [Nanobdellota archaeon]
MKTKNKFISAVLALTLVGVLLFSGSSNAVDMLLTPDSSVQESETADIKMGVDIKENEHLPVEALKVIVGDKACVFLPDGTKKANECAADEFGEISVINQVGYGTGYGYGYGYGYSFESNSYVTEGTNFGEGYGYGYKPGYGPGNEELRYNIQWNAPSVSEDTDYKVSFLAKVNGPSASFAYVSDEKTITVENYVSSSSSSDSSSSSNRRPFWEDSERSVASSSSRFLDVSAGDTISLDVDEPSLTATSIKAMIGESKSAVEVNVKESDNPDASGREPSGKVFQYVDVSVDADVESVDIEFKVPFSWLEENNVAKENVALYHYKNNKWDELSANYLSSDDEYAHYKATSDSLSVFAVGEKSETTQAPEETDETDEKQDTSDEETTDDQKDSETGDSGADTPTGDDKKVEPDEKTGSGVVGFLIILGIIAVGVGGYYLWKQKQ